MSPWLSTTVNTESTKEGLKRLLDSDTLDANFDRGLTAVSHQSTIIVALIKRETGATNQAQRS